MDDEKWEKVFSKLDALHIEQIHQRVDIDHINKTLFTNNGEICIVTKLNDLNASMEELKKQRYAVVSTAQAIWAIIFGFLSLAGIASTIILTVKQISGK